MPEYHAYSQTVADGTATSVVRPSDWNSAHLFSSSLAGNTLGQSTFSGSNLVLAGGNNITLSASQAAGQATISFEGLPRQSNSVYLFGNTAGISSSLTNNPAVANLAGGVNVTVNYTTNTAGNRIVEILGQEHAVSCPNGSSTFKTLSFQNTNGVTWNTVAAGVRLAHELQYTSNAVGLGTSFSGTNISGSMTVNTNGIALALSADAAGGGGQLTEYAFPALLDHDQNSLGLNASQSTYSAFFLPFVLTQGIKCNCIEIPIGVSGASTSNSSGAGSRTLAFGVYSFNASTLSLISSISFGQSWTASSASMTASRPYSAGDAGYSYSSYSANASSQWAYAMGCALVNAWHPAVLRFPGTFSLSENVPYFLGVHIRQSTVNSRCGMSLVAINLRYQSLYGAPYIGPPGISADLPSVLGVSAFVRNAPFLYASSTADYGGSTLPSTIAVSRLLETNTIFKPIMTFYSR